MKKDRNCGNMYPVYPPYQNPSMPVPMPMMGPFPYQTTQTTNNYEQQINNLNERINSLTKRVSNLEEMVNQNNMVNYSNSNYNSSNYPMM